MQKRRSLFKTLASLATLVLALGAAPAAWAQGSSAKIAPDLAAVINPAVSTLMPWAKQQNGQRYAQVLIVATGDDTNLVSLRSDILLRGGSVHYVYLSVRALAGMVPVSALNALAARPDVLAIAPNRVASRSGSLLQDSSGASAAVRSGTMLPLDGSGVGIAVLDSGIDYNHRNMLDANGKTRVSQVVDIAGYSKAVSKLLWKVGLDLSLEGAKLAKVTGVLPLTLQKDLAAPRSYLPDPYGHGTHVASVAAGSGGYQQPNSTGIAPNATLYDVRVLNEFGVGTMADVLAGIDWVIQRSRLFNIRVMNLSLAASSVDSFLLDPLARAARSAVAEGIVVVVAAGNAGKTAAGAELYGAVGSPGHEPSVITVGASNPRSSVTRGDDSVAGFSSRGPTRGSLGTAGGRWVDNLIKPDLVAPGNRLLGAVSNEDGMAAPNGNLLATLFPALMSEAGAAQSRNQELMLLSGTSVAAPAVAGAAALLLQANPGLTPPLVKAILQYSAQPLPTANLLQQVERELARRAAGEGGGYEIALLRPDGSSIDCFNQATPIYDERGLRIGSVGLWTDISGMKRAERALRETSEALRQKSQVLQETLASLGQGVLHCDADGRLLAWNQRMVELLELPESLFHAETRHADLSKFLIARGDLQPSVELLDESGQRMPVPGTPGHLPDLYVRRTPSGLLLEVRTRRLPDGGMVRTFADVTAYLQALNGLAGRERAQRDLLQAFPGFIAVTDHHFRYTYVNPRFAALIGQTPEQLVGRSVPDVLGEARFVRVQAMLEQARREGPVTTESDYSPTADRPRVRLQVTHAVGQDPATGRERVFAFGIDITAAKAAEEALVAARDEAERANRAKSQFLSSMSHELRTPLNAILGFGHLLATDAKQPLSAGQQRQMDEILHGARHLLQLINELLDLAVIEGGNLPVHLQPVALAPALGDALALLQPLAASRGVALPLAPAGLLPGATVMADPVRLKQVLLNLLGNAIKYNRPQGTVRLLCDPLARAGEAPGSAGWRITVQDSGPGLDEAQQARLFSAFDRLGAEAGPVEGTGLGLALSRGLVRAMGGELGVHSRPGEGSSFWLQLDAAAPDATAPALPAPRPPASTTT